jgi:hypothetical protein
MEVYYEPLCIYCRATSYRTLGEPEEIVGGFFASRLSDPTWIARWRDESRARSMPLRRWLLNGLCFYMREEARRQRRARLLADAGVVLGPRVEVRVDADGPACDAPRRLEMLSQEVYDRAAEGGGEVASPGEAPAAGGEASAPARRRGGPRLADAAVAAFDAIARRASRVRSGGLLRHRLAERFVERQERDCALSPAEQAFERDRARRIVALAAERTRVACVAAGQSLHFEVFMRHQAHGTAYDAIAPNFGLTEVQCAGMVRTASAKFRRELCQILRDEGVDPHDLDREIARLMEALRP